MIFAPDLLGEPEHMFPLDQDGYGLGDERGLVAGVVVGALVGCDAGPRVEAFAEPVGPAAGVGLTVGVEG